MAAPLRKATLLASALVSGAGGLGAEVLILSTLGLLVGYDRSLVLGLALWLSAWALGAWIAGRCVTGAPRRALVIAGLAAGLGIPLATYLVLLCAPQAWPDAARLLVAVALVPLAALPQGMFLPLLARAWDTQRGGARDVSGLFAANLLGAVVAARWIGFDLAAALGRLPASFCAGALSLVAGLLAAAAARAAASGNAGHVPDGRAAARGGLSLARWRAGLVAALLTVWLGGVQLVGLRLGAVWLGGMQPAITATLAASMLALAAGSLLMPRLLPADGRAALVLFALAACGCAWLVGPWSAAALRALGGEGPELRMLCLLAPALVPLGAVIPVLHRACAGESGRRLGDLLLPEAAGALLGLPLVHLVLLPALGSGGTLAALCVLGVPAAVLLAPAGRGPALAGGLLSLLVGTWVLSAPQPLLHAPALDNPAFTRISFREDASFAVTVVQDGVRGERTLLTDDFRATAVGDDYLYMRVLGHLPLVLHPDPKRVAVLAFGTGTTAGAVSLHEEVERIELLEISPAVMQAAPHFLEVNHGVAAEGLPGLLDEGDGAGRVVLRLGDGRHTLARWSGELDVVTMEPLLPDSPFAVYLYTEEFYRVARRALAPGGLLCQWVPPHALEPEVFDAVVGAFSRAFEWSGVFLFGTQVVLVGADRTPALSEARMPAAGSPAHAAMSDLGLHTSAGVMARYVTAGAAWPVQRRPLTDADPWIIYRPRRRGLGRLADLPRNLARLRELEQRPPLEWTVAAGSGGLAKLEQVRRLHRAREAWARWDLERRGVSVEWDGPRLDLAELRSSLSAVDDPEVAQFERQVRFDEARTQGVADLMAGDVGGALRRLSRAAELRPGRADVHLFLALALERAGESQVAREALDRALQLCPRLLETPQGLSARKLGLSIEAHPLGADH